VKEIVKKHIKPIIVLGVLLLICDFISTLPPYIVKKVVEIDFSKEDMLQMMTVFICIYILLHLSIVIFKYIRDILMSKTICKIL